MNRIVMPYYAWKLPLLAVLVAIASCGSGSLFAQMSPHIEKRQVIVQGGGYFPVLIRLKSGRLLVAYRTDAPHIGVKGKLSVSWSDNNGDTWSPPVVAAAGKDDYRNQAMAELPNGEIILSFAILSGYDETGLKAADGKELRVSQPLCIVRSRDRGATWSAPEEMEATRPLVERNRGLSPFGKMMVLGDGSVSMSVYTEQKDQPSVAYLFRSTDAGHSWKMLAPIGEHIDETGILALSNHEILAAARTETKPHLLIGRSADNGKTWSSLSPVTAPGEIPGDLIQLQNGDVLLSFSVRNEANGTAVMLSHDGGRTWDKKTRMVLLDGAVSWDCGYPSSVQLPDGRIVTAYYQVDDAVTAPYHQAKDAAIALASTRLTAAIWRVPKEGKSR